jgi:hypothetical protein
MVSELTADEVRALARKLEARARRTHDRDLARAGALLRVLMAIMAEPAPAAELPVETDHCDHGRVH